MVFPDSMIENLRSIVRDNDLLTCDKCGIAAGEVDTATGIRARLHVRYLRRSSSEEEGDLSNFQATCSICIAGAKYLTAPRPRTIWLLSQVRRAGQEEQREVLNWLLKKFKV
jgi:hypothetical protein